MLLHGDFHHHNLVRHGDGWAAIDPKPLVGEPEMDLVTWLWNPVGVEPTAERTATRLRLLAACGFDPERLRMWAIVRGTCLGFPLEGSETESDIRQLHVVSHLID